jgi:hypothetical protein
MRLEVDDEAAALVEVDDQAFGVQRASPDADEVIRASKRLQDALAVIRPTALAVVDAPGGLKTDDPQVKSGEMPSGGVAAMIARTAATAHFAVTSSCKSRS